MGDQFDKIARDPRFKLKKKKQIEANQDDSRFKKVKSETKPLKDVRGRPWAQNPLDYVNSMLGKQNSAKINKALKSKEMIKEEFHEASDSEEEYSQSEESSSSDDDDDDNILHDSGESDIEDLVENNWDELVKNAPIREDATKRLAVLHFDWDESRPEDLLLVLESFLPKGGSLKSINVYPSEFGMDRMSKEKEVGPLELHENSYKVEPTDSAVPEQDVDSKANMLAARKKFREYQLTKLKYFYAIVEFDSVQSATAVYEQCDGMEYENSGVKLDLRFVDDAERFEVADDWLHLVRSCSSIDRDNYVPKKFETKALRSTKAYLPWDQTPKDREEWFKHGFAVDDFDKELDQEKLKQYVAFSSDEEESDCKTKLSVERARTLLFSNQSTGKEEDVEDEMELDKSADDEEETGGKTPRFAAVSAIISDDENSSDECSDDLNRDISHQKEKRKPNERLSVKKMKLDGSSSADSKPPSKKLKRKQLLKEKLKKKKQKDLEKVQLWDNGETDNRFDEFISDPTFTVSSAHPDYKNSKDFVDYMKKRKTEKSNS